MLRACNEYIASNHAKLSYFDINDIPKKSSLLVDTIGDKKRISTEKSLEGMCVRKNNFDISSIISLNYSTIVTEHKSKLIVRSAQNGLELFNNKSNGKTVDVLDMIYSLDMFSSDNISGTCVIPLSKIVYYNYNQTRYTLNIWNWQTKIYEKEYIFPDYITAILAVGQNFVFILTAKTLYLYDIDTDEKQTLDTFPHDSMDSYQGCMALTYDKKLLVCRWGTYNNYLHVIDLVTKQSHQYTTASVNTYCVMKMIPIDNKPWVILVSPQIDVQLFDYHSGKVLSTIPDKYYGQSACLLGSNVAVIVYMHELLFVTFENGLLKVEHVIPAPMPYTRQLMCACAIRETGKLLVGDRDGYIDYFDIPKTKFEMKIVKSFHDIDFISQEKKCNVM
jgi:hypothetical protein